MLNRTSCAVAVLRTVRTQDWRTPATQTARPVPTIRE
jgi:hypothetical protein